MTFGGTRLGTHSKGAPRTLCLIQGISSRARVGHTLALLALEQIVGECFGLERTEVDTVLLGVKAAVVGHS